jgi:lysozyme family protein
MSEANFAEALRRLLTHEGGYSNHPADPGGPTKYGVTIGDYRRYIRADGSAADVKAMTVDEAKKIYRERYWNVMRCDELPSGVEYAVFDYAVNSGVARAAKVLRRALGLPGGSAAVTVAVVNAAKKSAPEKVVIAICDERLSFLKSLKTWPTFGAGWERRVNEVRAAALKMARASPATEIAPANRKSNAAVAASVFSIVVGAVAAWMQSTAFWIAVPLAIATVAAGVWWFLHRKQTGKRYD